MERVDVVYACIINEKDEILMVYNCDTNHWSLPGGCVETGEFLDEALKREVQEETGYLIKENGLISVNERKLLFNNQHAVFYTFKSEIIGGEKTISHPEEISKIEWKSIKDADELMPYFDKSIKEIMKRSIPYQNQGTY